MTKSNSRRRFLQTIGALAATAPVAVSAAAAPSPSQAPRSSLDGMQVDVLVAGGGPSGIGAALAAARHGMKTLLVENHAFLGGVAAWCLGMPMNQMRPLGKPRSKVHELVIKRSLSYGPHAARLEDHALVFNVDYLKAALFDVLDEAGCQYLVATRVVDAVMEQNRIVGVVLATKDGLAAIRAKTIVDCTGDADVAYLAGAETLKEAGRLSPMTLCLNVTNVDLDAATRVDLGPVVAKARSKYPLIPAAWSLGRLPSSNCLYINHAGTRELGNFDATDPWQRTKAENLSRHQVIQMVEAMREFGPECLRHIELSGVGPQLGVRETRRLKGLYLLTEEDAKQGRRFDDVISWRSGLLDIGFVRLEPMKVHHVPYRALVPEKVDGLLVAGRCISATHVGASAGKSMGNCMATGHAAGLAATLAARKDCVPRAVNVADLQASLRADGVDLTRGGEDQKL